MQVRVYQHESSPAIVFWRDSRWRLNDVGATDGWLYSNESLLGQWAEDAEAADFSGVYGTPYPCVTVAEDPKQAHADKFALLRVLFQALKRELPRERDPSCQRVLEMLRQDSVQHAFWIKSDGGIPVNWGALLEERLRLLEEQAINAMEYGMMGGAVSGCDDEGENSVVRDCDAVSWVTFERFCWESITAVVTRSKSEEAAEAAAVEAAAAQPKARSVSVVAPAEHALRDTLVCAGHPTAAPPSTPPSARVLQYGDDEVCTPQAPGGVAEGEAADTAMVTATASPAAAAGPTPSAEGTPPQRRSSNSKERRHSAEPGMQRSNSVDTAATMPAASPSPQATPAAATPGSNGAAAVEPSPSHPEPSPQLARSEPPPVPSPPQPQQPQQPAAVPPPTEAEAELEAMRREMRVMKASLALTAEFETETDQAVSEHAAGLYKLEAAFLRQRAELVEAERRVVAAAEAEQREAERKDLERRLAEVETQAREKLDREEKRTEKLQQLLTQRAVRTPSAGSPTVPSLRLDASGSSFPPAASPPLPEAARLRDSTAARPAETPAPPAAAPAATPPAVAAPPDLREQIRDKKRGKKDKGEDDSGCCVVC